VIEALATLVLGLTLRLLVWLTLKLVVGAARLVWTCVTEHPAATFLLVLTAHREDWVTSTWTPYVLVLLAVLAAVRFFVAHPPAQILKRARQERDNAQKVASTVVATGNKARAFARKVRRAERRTEAESSPSRPLRAVPDAR
jgi:hypothetical protein